MMLGQTITFSWFVLQSILKLTSLSMFFLQPCGVDYELKTYVAESETEKPHKRNSVRLAIRKLTYAPDESAPQPRAECTKEFMMSSGKLKVEASLDKEVGRFVLICSITSLLIDSVHGLCIDQKYQLCVWTTPIDYAHRLCALTMLSATRIDYAIHIHVYLCIQMATATYME